MPRSMTPALTLLAMIAFAANSLLCRLALKQTGVDAASFTSVRLLSGALALALIVRARGQRPAGAGGWLSAAALFAYAGCFSYAYASLPAATGSLLLFGAVQVTMIGAGLMGGEHLGGWQAAGLVCAFGGLVVLLLPGLAAPPLAAAALMLCAGTAWGLYSLRGRRAGDPAAESAGNFLRAVPMAAVLSLITLPGHVWNGAGLGYALASGALASGAGYVIWFAALKGLSASHAAAVQLSVPVLAAAGGILFLGEQLTARLAIASVVVLGGIALTITSRRGSP